MKTATLILSLFMLFKPIFPVVEYVVLYDYITKELCVNKDKPEMECNGKCHLMKEMAKNSDADTKDKYHSFSVETQIVFYQDLLSAFSANVAKPHLKKVLFSKINTYSFSFCNLIFHPPVF